MSQSNFGITMAVGSAPTAGGQQSAGMPSEEAMLTFIVDKTNEVLKRQYSLVDFDDLRETALMTVVADLFRYLSPDAPDIGPHPGPQRQALLDFLRTTIGYKVPPILQHNFDGLFLAAEKQVVNPVLFWTLQNMKQCEKRVYLARFLKKIPIPEDVRVQDERVKDLFQRYEQLRADFIETHKRVDMLRDTHSDPSEARKRIEGLEKERERLNTYIAAAQKKISNVSNRDAFVAACKLLRAEQEEQGKLNDKHAEQQQALYAAERRSAETSTRLKQVQRDQQDGRVDAIIRRLRDDIQTSRMKLDEDLPKEMNEKRVENAALQKLLSEPLDFAALNEESTQLDAAVKELQQKVRDRQRPANDGESIEVMRNHVKRSAAKKAEVMESLRQVQAENDRVIAELRERERTIDQFRAQKVLSGDEFKRYSNQVRSKTATTKTMKQKIADMHAEWGVLSYTKTRLEEEFSNLKAEIRKMEDAMGIRGYSDKAENLNRVTAEKDAVEDVKGRTLEELSRIVQEIMISIRDRRNRLKPQVAELQAQRQVAAEVDQQWDEYRAQYELQEGLLMQDVTKIESEVTTLDEETRLNEALYHRLHHQQVLLDAMVTRAAEERKHRAGASSLDLAGCKSYAELLERSIVGVEGRSKDLQRRRRQIDENHDTNVQQVEWFQALRKVLEEKAASAKAVDADAAAARAQGNSAANIDRDIAAVMAPQRGGAVSGGVDMLVLGNE